MALMAFVVSVLNAVSLIFPNSFFSQLFLNQKSLLGLFLPQLKPE